MRRMSFAMTIEALVDGRKTVTRRLGWAHLNVGDHLLAVDRIMGFKKGEKARVLGEIEVVDVPTERLDAITQDDVIAEGFEWLTPKVFVHKFCRAMKCTPETMVRVIRFRRVENAQDPPK